MQSTDCIFTFTNREGTLRMDENEKKAMELHTTNKEFEANNLTEVIKGKCLNCGSTLRFDPKNQCLICDSCGSVFEIPKSNQEVEENDFMTYLQTYQKNAENSINKETKIYARCEECGALIIIDKNDLTATCPFCGSNKTIKQTMEENENIHIEGVIPFQISIEDNNQLFKKWIKKRFWAPNKIKNGILHPLYHAFYMPIWTYDANTNSTYSAMRGDYYYVTVSRHTSNGHVEMVQERRIHWTPVHGTMPYFFDDIVIRASKNVLDKYIDQVGFYNLKNSIKYDEKYLLGYQAERASLDLVDGFNRAKNVMSNILKHKITKEIGGDTISSLKINTNYKNVKFKQLLCPMYNGSYKIKGSKNTYHFVINGQTGQFYGDYPKSPVKITIFVFIIIFIIIALILMFNYFFLS